MSYTFDSSHSCKVFFKFYVGIIVIPTSIRVIFFKINFHYISISIQQTIGKKLTVSCNISLVFLSFLKTFLLKEVQLKIVVLKIIIIRMFIFFINFKPETLNKSIPNQWQSRAPQKSFLFGNFSIRDFFDNKSLFSQPVI